MFVGLCVAFLSRKCTKNMYETYRVIPVNDHGRRQDAEDHEPKPQEDVDFFIDDVQWQYAYGIVGFHLAGYAELVENALGHPREYEDHRVHPVLLVALQKPYHVYAERQERTVEETVHHEHLACTQ